VHHYVLLPNTMTILHQTNILVNTFFYKIEFFLFLFFYKIEFFCLFIMKSRPYTNPIYP